MVSRAVNLRQVVEALARQTDVHRRDQGPWADEQFVAERVSVDLVEWYVLYALLDGSPLCTRTRRDPSTGETARCVFAADHIEIGELDCTFLTPKFRSVDSLRRDVLALQPAGWQVDHVARTIAAVLTEQGVELTPEQLESAAAAALVAVGTF